MKLQENGTGWKGTTRRAPKRLVQNKARLLLIRSQRIYI